jgi:hypothetical protein
MEKVADWPAAPDATEHARAKRRLRCLACDEPVEKSLSALGSLRCLACRESNAPLDPTLLPAQRAKRAV